MNQFASRSGSNASFIIKNVSSLQKDIKIFNRKILFGEQVDLLKISGISEEDIKSSLSKGVLFNKLSIGEIQVVFSDIDLIYFNDSQRALLEANGVSTGTSNPVLGAVTPGNTVNKGSATELARADHIHSVLSGSPVPPKFSGLGCEDGGSVAFSRADHVHDMGIPGPAEDIGYLAKPGTGTGPARSDHVHSLPVVDGYGLAPLSAIRYRVTAGVGGTADDVVIYNANAPFDFRVLDTFMIVSTAAGSSTVTLRTATGGGGTALSDSLSSASTGVVRTSALTTTSTVSKGGSLVLRRSNNTVAVEFMIYIQLV